AVTIAPAVGRTATFNTLNFYVDQGDLSFQGPTTFSATSSTTPTTITARTGNITNTAASTLSLTGGGTSQYQFCNGNITNGNVCGNSNGKGVVLNGPAN